MPVSRGILPAGNTGNNSGWWGNKLAFLEDIVADPIATVLRGASAGLVLLLRGSQTIQTPSPGLLFPAPCAHGYRL